MSYKNFSDGYKKALVNAENNVKNLGLKELTPEDVVLEIVSNASWAIKELFMVYGIDKKLMIEILDQGLFNQKVSARAWVYAWMSTKLKNVILWSAKIAASFSKPKASIEDFLLSMLKNDPFLPSFLDHIGINTSDIEVTLNEVQKLGAVDGSKTGWLPKEITNDEEVNKLLWDLSENLFGGLSDSSTPFDNNKNPNKKETSDTPALDFFSTDLTAEAREGKIDNIIGREVEIERLISILNRKTKNNPALVWEPGVGKTAIVEWLALKIASGDVPFSMRDKRVLELDITSMVAGTKYRGEFEQRIKQVIEEASKVENEIILFIDEIHTIIGAGGGEWSLDASNILKPAMGRWKIRVIGATTLNEYQKYIEKDTALERRFQKIVADEPTPAVALEILTGIKDIFEQYHNLNITDAACAEAVDISVRYITDRYLPDKAIDLIDEACSLKSMKYNFDEKETKKLKAKAAKLTKQIEDAVIAQQYKKASSLKDKQKEIELEISDLKKKFIIPKDKRLSVDVEDIKKVLSMSTGIPISNLNKTEIERLKSLPKTIKSQIIGQDDAVESIVKSIIRSKAGIGDSNRPLWSFLFLGPTGVGKTELVKVLTKEFYDDKDALIKIDMSEFSDKTSVNKLIGSSAGYVGYEEWGMLTEKVRKKPYSVVLFDEIEKGDFEVYNLLLQILEEGMLTDNKGRKINFKNTIIIMTSNIGQDEFSEKASAIWFDVSSSKEQKIMQDYEKAKQNIKDNLTDYFSPEFVNRIDKVVVFNPLDKKEIKKIVKLQLSNLEKRLESKSITLSYDTKVLNYITKKVYNPQFGAREIRRFITDHMEDAIAESIITVPSHKDFKLSIEKDELKVT